ncbi:hypothetical protein Q4485_14450 [Granulosicoccaceae sp. 1_MG-2023]|nr:hypothetical protein [Granulosicoccaceae sp. 1_MG-2023]
MKQVRTQSLLMGGLFFNVLLCTGCTRDQVMQLTYETLRQEDCHRTDLHTEYCDRSYAFDYARYKKLRETYLQEMAEQRELALSEDVAFILPTREN